MWQRTKLLRKKMIELTKRFLQVVYGIYAWTIFLLIGGTTLVLLLIVPGLKVRRMIGSGGARLWLLLAGNKKRNGQRSTCRSAAQANRCGVRRSL
jgi:hypothetical protein